MLRLKLCIRLLFVKLPHIPDVRIFRDCILCMDPDERCYQDLSDLVERKLTFMELPPTDFTVFYREPVQETDEASKQPAAGTKAGDRVVVDTAYFSELLHRWWDSISNPTSSSAHGLEEGHYRAADHLYGFDEDTGHTKEVHVSFEVEVNKLLSDNALGCAGVGVSMRIPSQKTIGGVATAHPPGRALLTAENLKALTANASPAAGAGARRGTALFPEEANNGSCNSTPPTQDAGERLVHVDELTSPPRIPSFFLRCVVVDLRFKTPKPGLSVTEIDLCDAAFPQQYITAVSFDAVVQKEVKENLRSDGRQVIELRKVYVRVKNESDMRYATNAHPLLLRIDRNAKVEIVQILPVPIHGRAGTTPNACSSGTIAGPHGRRNAVVTVRETPRPAAIVELSDLVGMPLSLMRGAPTAASAGAALPETPMLGAGLVAKSCSSGCSAPRRTTFSLLNSGLASAVPPSAVLPSGPGRVPHDAPEQFMKHLGSEEVLPFEPGLIPVTSKDVRARESVLVEHTDHELRRKERIRRRKEVSTACILCGLDCEERAGCMETVSGLLKASSRNRGQHIPTFEQLKQALCDSRGVKLGDTPTRLVSNATFVNTMTKTVHVVHCRCAHLCTSYQNGKELEDIVWCDLPMQVCTLCGKSGACVACYHPECNEIYHVPCALFSGGYVNFGKKDPYLPCPACPRHTQVVLPNKKRKDEVLHTDESCWTDDVAFDSRVVNATDLRDPDENDGE